MAQPVGRRRPGQRYPRVAFATVILLVLAALATLGYRAAGRLWPRPAAEQAAAIGGSFSLIDGAGRPVTDRTYRGKWLILFFGYTHCPDVCPTTLADIAQAWHALGPLGDAVQPVFITVDPRRDTPQAMRDFVARFDERIAALTGSPEQIAAAARAYQAYYDPGRDAPDEAMAHSAVIYVVRPDGRYAGFLPPDAGAPAIASRVRALVTGGR